MALFKVNAKQVEYFEGIVEAKDWEDAQRIVNEDPSCLTPSIYSDYYEVFDVEELEEEV
jgi:uncharacterized protein YciI